MRLGKVLRKEEITVDFLIQTLINRLHIPIEKLNDVVVGDRKITERDIHRPGLAMVGFTELFTFHRVQILGNTECRYLSHLTDEMRIQAFHNLIDHKIPCIFLTDGNDLSTNLIEMATEKGVPVFKTTYPSAKFIYLVTDFLDDQFSPQQQIHGVLVDVYGIGILLTGRSGIGKSEVGLDLIERGHRLVSDDVVLITRKGEGVLMGTSNNLAEHFMEIRGVGIIDIRSIFGVRAIRFQKRVELVVDLMEWNPNEEYTRTGLDEDTISILDVNIPHIKLPIFAGKNVTVIVEVIALNHLLKHYGYDAAQVFAQKLQNEIQKKRSVQQELKRDIDRMTQYFEHDFE